MPPSANEELLQACQQLKSNFTEINEAIERHMLWTAQTNGGVFESDEDPTIFHQSADEEQFIASLLICITFNIL